MRPQFIIFGFLCLIIGCTTLRFQQRNEHRNNKPTQRHLQTTNLPSNSSMQIITSEPPEHKEWRKDILNGITNLKKLGLPGQALVFGNNATVIAVGDQSSDILIAAAALGKGRIVVITHDAYLENFTSENSDPNVKKLHQNIKKWITKNKFSSNSNLSEAFAFVKSTTNQKYLALYTNELSDANTTETDNNKILNFVKNGGGLVMAICPWGWVQIKQTNDFNKMLTYKTFLAAGIILTQDVIDGSDTLDLTKSKLELSHLGIQAGIVLSPQKQNFDYSTTRSIASQVKRLPDSQKSKLQTLIKTAITSNQIALMTPSQANPIRSDYLKSKMLFYQYAVLESASSSNIAPGYNLFPGQVNKSDPRYKLQQKVFTFKAPGFQEFHHTGYYAVAGQVITIQITGEIPDPSWQVSIGFHYDDDSDVEEWVIWPTVSVTKELNSKKTQIKSPFGGLIVFRSPHDSSSNIQVKVSNILEAPFYDSQNQNLMKDWARRKAAAGIWGCAQGKYVGFCVPKSSLETAVNIKRVLDLYDKIYIAYHDLRGTKPSDQRRQYIVADIQPSMGYMHSGYPIVTMMDITIPTNDNFLFNLTYIQKIGQWGIFHEMGHNMQRDWWTFEGTVEVTCNIFSLKAVQIAVGTSPKNSKWLQDQKQNSLKYLKSPDFEAWKADPGVALMIYAQVIQDFGWEVIKRVLTSYESSDSSSYPTEQQGKIDLFWSKMSIEAGVNLQSLLKKWGIPYTSNFTNKVKKLPGYKQKVNLLA